MPEARPAAPTRRSLKPLPPAPETNRNGTAPRKLTYKEQRELETLPGKIEALEEEQSELHARLGEGGFYRQGSDQITATLERLEIVKLALEASYQRWQELESLGGR
jgi:ATP-binding cassette subfamily F protein uup